MYSKARGYSSLGGRPRPPYMPPGHSSPAGYGPSYGTTPSSSPAPDRMQVPPGYRGNAIVNGEERPLGQAPAQVPGTTVSGREDAVADMRPRFESLPRVMPSPTFISSDEPTERITYEEDTIEERQENASTDLPNEPSIESARGALFGSTHFPFGHGLGVEELLLVGLIVLLLHEDHATDGPGRGDLDETILLLGLLLFGG